MQKTIGITGGIACGKSLVSTYLQKKDCTVLDADVGARLISAQGTQAAQEIRDNFGEEYFLATGEINRTKLASLIFNNDHKRILLNNIMHPKIFAWLIAEREKAYKPNKNFIFMDIPLLYESNFPFADEVIVVYVPPEIQLKRLIKRDKLAKGEAKQRIMSQYPLAKKVQLANYVIENSGTIEQTYLQIDDLLQRFILP